MAGLTRESRATEPSIEVLQAIVGTINRKLEQFSSMVEADAISAEDYSLLETNLLADIQNYQSKITRLSDTLCQVEKWEVIEVEY